MTTRQTCCALTVMLGSISGALAQSTNAAPVTVDNFIRAETDLYMGNIVKDGGFGKFNHRREPATIENQTVIRLNRDTLYSAAVFDLDAGPELDHVEIQLQDAPLGERALELPGQERLLRLAQRVARRGEPEVLGELLGDGGRPARELAVPQRVLERVLHLGEREAVVREEADVLGDQHRALERGRDRGVGRPGPGDAGRTARRALLGAVALDERGGRGTLGGEPSHRGPPPDLDADPDRGGQQHERHQPSRPSPSPAHGPW